MAYTKVGTLGDVTVNAFNPVLGTPGGTRMNILSPVRGLLLEAGFIPNSLVTSAITMAVAIGNQVSSAASNFTQCITSTLGTFSSTNLYEGAPCSVAPPSQTYVNPGDAIQFTHSGGNTSLIGGVVYATIRKA